jgi:hypothetical protein
MGVFCYFIIFHGDAEMVVNFETSYCYVVIYHSTSFKRIFSNLTYIFNFILAYVIREW